MGALSMGQAMGSLQRIWEITTLEAPASLVKIKDQITLMMLKVAARAT